MSSSISTYGPAYSPVLDGARIRTQMEVVRDFMLKHCLYGKMFSLADIEAKLGYPEASISAQLRHLRKEKFGAYQVEKVRRGEGGTWQYSVKPPLPKGQMKLL